MCEDNLHDMTWHLHDIKLMKLQRYYIITEELDIVEITQFMCDEICNKMFASKSCLLSHERKLGSHPGSGVLRFGIFFFLISWHLTIVFLCLFSSFIKLASSPLCYVFSQQTWCATIFLPWDWMGCRGAHGIRVLLVIKRWRDRTSIYPLYARNGCGYLPVTKRDLHSGQHTVPSNEPRGCVYVCGRLRMAVKRKATKDDLFCRPLLTVLNFCTEWKVK